MRRLTFAVAGAVLAMAVPVGTAVAHASTTSGPAQLAPAAACPKLPAPPPPPKTVPTPKPGAVTQPAGPKPPCPTVIPHP